MAYQGITATVLQKNNEQYFCDPCGNYGQDMNIPCGAAFAEVQAANYYAQPVTTDFVQGFSYTISDTAPDPYSVPVFKLINLTTGDYYVVMGTKEEYFQACAACCDTSPLPSIVSDERLIIPATQVTCPEPNTSNFDGYFALPFLGANEHYQIAGSLNGAALPTFTPTNITTAAGLVTWLNSNWGTAGTWTAIAPSPSGLRVRRADIATIGFTACAVPN